ncbi:MAG: S-adenosylmethionine:tRNA ribosyltransferase-isomerase [Solirubrobacteraceae bacterium]|jgi:S-adenosylmethionine:tRNA ribosyltransferase-isomerase|nr:S-adenosylmethionine:tRNA ribosyltransferase-isomerase [Solirubrobacteraceae bacterium]
MTWTLPARLEATEPPATRDGVRLMVAHRASGRIDHLRFHDLPEVLSAGDLLVVNVSATLAASIGAGDHRIHVSMPAPDGDGWIVELRSRDGAAPRDGYAGTLALDGGATLTLTEPYSGDRLWRARFDGDLEAYMAEHGRPIRYGYVTRDWPLAEYQTAFALRPGSAEMPSAARPFTPELVTRLVAGGVLFAPITLHCGVSSPERHEPPYPERYEVSDATARVVDAVHGWGGRVIAVGTTAVRALESVSAPDGTVSPAVGWTDLVVTPDPGLWTVDGVITGWHEPEASHLDLLEAAAGEDLLRRSYAEALDRGYRWHEFGDSHLILP